jgi:protein-S-isoprenylcysteine O-methyltransferase Ste14
LFKEKKILKMNSINFLQLTSYVWLVLILYWLFAGMHTKITVKKEASTNRIIYLVLMVTAFALVYESRLRIGFLGQKFMLASIYTDWVGLAINVGGIGLAIAARWTLGENWSGRVTVKKDHTLVQTGPYALTRHPIYTGIFFALIGAVIVQGEVRGLLALVLLFIALHMKITQEEKFMKQLFPTYAEYSNRTKRLIPLIY